VTDTVAVIDLGKTTSKVTLVDTKNAQELAVIKQAAATDSTTAYLSLDHNAIETFVVESLTQLSAQTRIDAITVTTHGATVALLDAEGKLALPVLDYECVEVDETRSEYEEHRDCFSVTGSPALPGGLNVGAQLFWQQRQHSALFSNATTLLTWPQYWVFLMTGEKHNDLTSLGCHTDLYNPYQKRYSSLVERMHWQALLPPTKRSGEYSGVLKLAVAAKAGLSENTPVHAGIHDSNASLVPHLISRTAPLSVVSTGTWFIVMAMGGLSRPLSESQDTLTNVNAFGDSVPSARFMGGRERELLNASSPVTEADLDRILTHIDTAAVLMPSVVTRTGPYPDLQNLWLGQTPEDNTADKNCVVAFYLALMTHECMTLIGSAGPTFVEGPLAQDTVFLRMLAVVSNRDVYYSESVTGTSVGAAMLIQKPLTPPPYTKVVVENDMRSKMQTYATRWHEALALHRAS